MYLHMTEDIVIGNLPDVYYFDGYFARQLNLNLFILVKAVLSTQSTRRNAEEGFSLGEGTVSITAISAVSRRVRRVRREGLILGEGPVSISAISAVSRPSTLRQSSGW